MKKIISIALCTIIALMGTVSVSATTEEKHYGLMGTTKIPDNTVRVYKSGTGMDSNSCIKLYDCADSSETVINLPQTTSSYIDTSAPSTEGYEMWSCFTGFGSSLNLTMYYNNTGGTYRQIKLKLSDFSSYFNEDGTRTYTLGGETHDYNFTAENDGHTSGLLIVSGASVTFAVPDKNGYVTFYMSPNIGDGVRFKTTFRVSTENAIVSGGGITSFFKGLMVGDADSNNYITVLDATYLQKCLADIENLDTDALTKFRCDTNGDGVINVADATAIQKYLVKK